MTFFLLLLNPVIINFLDLRCVQTSLDQGPAQGQHAARQEQVALVFRAFDYLRTRVNLINICCANFSYKSASSCFSKPKCNKRKAVQSTFVQKFAQKMLIKLTTGDRGNPQIRMEISQTAQFCFFFQKHNPLH